jgi:ankyrin repeat protein
MGYTDTVKLLLENKADPDVCGESTDRGRRTISNNDEIGFQPVNMARRCSSHVIKSKKTSSKYFLSTRQTQMFPVLLFPCPIRWNTQMAQGGKYGTALQAVILTGQTATVKLLLEHDADPNILGENTLTILGKHNTNFFRRRIRNSSPSSLL